MWVGAEALSANGFMQHWPSLWNSPPFFWDRQFAVVEVEDRGVDVDAEMDGVRDFLIF